MKKTKKSLVLLIACLFMLSSILVACGKKTDNPVSTTPEKKVKVGIVLSTGGKGDKSFNDSAIAGLEKAKKELGIEYKDIQPKDVADDEKSLEFLAKEGYDLVIAVGFMMGDALAKVAPKYPNTKFAIIDSSYDKPADNIKCLVFKEHEGSYLAGMLAASMSKTDVVGYVGGMDMPLIHRFEGGFTAGVKAVKPNATVLAAYAGTDGGAFNNPAKGKEIALDMISKKADIIYHASGGTGQGVFEAAESKGILAIGVDSNQNWVKPGTIIASMLKKVDIAVFNTVKDVKDNKFKGGKDGMGIFGLKENGVGLTDLTNLTVEESAKDVTADNQKKIKDLKATIPADVKTKIEEAKTKISNGEIKVPDWMIDGKPKQ